MKILLIEPFYGGSHQQWADGLMQNSQHSFEMLSLKDKHWKWRMSNAAVTLARRFMDSNCTPHLIIATDMLNLPDFQALTRTRTHSTPFVLYMHENQITYPIQNPQTHDFHYGLINFKSALCANAVWFNSEYHKNIFLSSLPAFLQQFPLPNEKNAMDLIAKKSKVLPIGLNFDALDTQKNTPFIVHQCAVLLWNHRWEHDKNPEQFFKVLKALKLQGIPFKLLVLGEKNAQYPPIFDEMQQFFQHEILYFGYAQTREQYAQLLWQADILPVTSLHDFFGISVVEAIYCNVVPLLPKRLAYPEHLPKDVENAFFYTDEQEMMHKLQDMIANVAAFRKQKMAQFVEKYSWNTLINLYDSEIEKQVSIFAK